MVLSACLLASLGRLNRNIGVAFSAFVQTLCVFLKMHVRFLENNESSCAVVSPILAPYTFFSGLSFSSVTVRI